MDVFAAFVPIHLRDCFSNMIATRVVSTYLFVNQPLSSAMLGDVARARADSVELFCSQPHFNYRSSEEVRKLAGWLEEHHLKIHSLHSPTERDLVAGRRESGIAISISEPERVRRVDAVDEVKRALEMAEQIPFPFLIQHLAHGRQSLDQRKLDAAFNSLEHLVIFAKQRGVTIALENTPGDLTSPSTLRDFIEETRLRDLRMCFDAGHAHIEDGIEASFEAMHERVVTTHLHDNQGDKDEHLLPYDGSIDWNSTLQLLASAPRPLPLVLELREQPARPVIDRIADVLDRLEQGLAANRAPNRTAAGD